MLKPIEPDSTLTDPRLAMEPDSPADRSSDSNFAFAFNDLNFSDRLLRIEIIPDSLETKSDGEDCSTIADWARNRKRRREDIKRENVVDFLDDHEEEIVSCHVVDTDGVDSEEPVAMVEELLTCPPGFDPVHQGDFSWVQDHPKDVEVKTLHISSPILAAKSPFFYKLFSNGMMESDQRQVTLQIHACEEAAFMELLNFMYSNTLSIKTEPGLLDVLMAADKFEVASCMRYCISLLRKLPMTCESALLYLDLPSAFLMADAVQPLTEAAKQFLAARYKDLNKFHEEVFKLPLAGFEAIVSSDDLQVASEDAVYDLILKWVRTHYPKLEDRREILGSRLGCHIRFPYMTCRKLKKVLSCNDFEPEAASKLVLEALFFKAEAPYRQRTLVAEAKRSSFHHRFVERAYKYRPIKVMEFELPKQQCIVYLDLKREDCAALFPSGRVYSQAFHLGGQGFFLSAHCNMDQQSAFHCFGLFLGMQEKGSITFAVDYEFAARTNEKEGFDSKYKGNYIFTGGKAVGYRNLFSLPWTEFMSEESPCFINGILHLRAELIIKRP